MTLPPAAVTEPIDRRQLGFYALAGAPRSPRDLIDEIRSAEAMGLGHAFISERFNIKEAATLCGAAGAVSDSIQITTAATNHTTRHPMVTASFASTMWRLTEGRFSLGLGRGIDRAMKAYGMTTTTTADLEVAADLYRRLWRGETVLGHTDRAGTYPVLRLDPDFDEPIPLSIVAFGPNTLDLAGRVFDRVVLHTFFTDDTTRRAVQIVKEAAERAGRDPDEVEVWSCFATIGDHLPHDVQIKKTVGRLATYLQAYGDLMVSTNDWDPAVLADFRADSFVASFPGALDAKATTSELEHVATLIPPEWLAPAATGSSAQCVAAVANQFDLGCDGVILHGANPTELAPIIEALPTT